MSLIYTSALELNIFLKFFIDSVYCRAQKELVEKERREEFEAKKKRHSHADDVRAQIREKEQIRVAERNAFFEEGVKLDEEARQRRAKLEDVKKKKLELLRYVSFSALYQIVLSNKKMLFLI